MSFIIRRIFFYGIAFFLTATITFFAMKIIPGDPFADAQGLPEATQELLRKHYALDQPVLVQYQSYLSGILHGNFGYSLKYKGESVSQIIKEGFPVSAILGLEALSFAIILGFLLGILSAAYHKKIPDILSLSFCSFGIAIPAFLLATALQYVIGMKLGWLPIARWGSFSHTILPALTLSILPACFIARMLRQTMIEIFNQDYVKAAKAKGLKESTILCRHILPNSIYPILPFLAQVIANLLTGSFIIEKIFSIPGLGRWFSLSVINRDYPLIMGITLFYTIILMSTMLFVDLIQGWLDPRIRHTQEI